MRTHALLALATGLLSGGMSLSAADEATDKAIKKDLEALQGTWRPVSVVSDGKKLPDKELKGVTVTYQERGKFSVTRGARSSTRGPSRSTRRRRPRRSTTRRRPRARARGRPPWAFTRSRGTRCGSAPCPPGRSGLPSSPPGPAAGSSSASTSGRRSKPVRGGHLTLRRRGDACRLAGERPQGGRGL